MADDPKRFLGRQVYFIVPLQVYFTVREIHFWERLSNELECVTNCWLWGLPIWRSLRNWVAANGSKINTFTLSYLHLTVRAAVLCMKVTRNTRPQTHQPQILPSKWTCFSWITRCKVTCTQSKNDLQVLANQRSLDSVVTAPFCNAQRTASGWKLSLASYQLLPKDTWSLLSTPQYDFIAQE